MHKELLDWYDQHKRDLPWRESREPYRVLVSELMLQQTVVASVIEPYRRWMERFPTIEALAAADLDDVLHAWQGLGYYRRARLLHQAAEEIALNGWPQDRKGMRAVPGIGPYTAGAVLSIAFDLPEPLVDGNVERVYARLMADLTPPPALTKRAWAWAEACVSQERPGDWNQALMELGATVCRPRTPLCHLCPWQEICRGTQGEVSLYPAPKVRPEMRDMDLPLAVCEQAGRYALIRYPEGGWWAGLYGFPPALASSGKELGRFPFVVTRHRLTVCVLQVDQVDGEVEWFSPDEFNALALPALHRRAWDIVRARQTQPTLAVAPEE